MTAYDRPERPRLLNRRSGTGRRHLTLAAGPGSEGLVGRAVERARVAELIRRSQTGRGGALVVRGEPGIGKTALVLDAVARAPESRVVIVRGVESEVELACSALGELVGALADSVERLPESQAAALRAVRGLADQPPVTDSYTICVAVHSLISLASEQRPLLVVVDDAHWLDPTSRDALLFVGRRLTEYPALFLMTVRTHEPGSGEWLGALPVMDLERLSAAESRILLGALTGEVGIDPRVAAELVGAADGNPLAVRELVSTLSAAQLRGRSPLPDPGAGGRALLGLISSRVARLDPAARRGLLVAAVCVDADLATVDRAVAAGGGAIDWLEHGERAGLVRLDGGRVEFTHPLLRSALVDAASPAARAHAFSALAAVADPEVKVLYQAAGAYAPEESIAAGLHQAADRARRSGGHLTAARTLARAAELSEASGLRAQRLIAAAVDARVAGRQDLAEAWARAAYAASDSVTARADARAEYGRAAMWAGRLNDARAVFADAAPHIEHVDRVRAVSILLDWALLEVMGARPRDSARAVGRATQLMPLDEMRAQRLRWPVVAQVMVLNGEVTPALDILDHGSLDLMPREDLLVLPPLGHIAQAFIWGERFDQAGELLDRIIDAARAAGAASALPNALAHRCEVGQWTGAWTLAAADAAESVRLARELGQAGAEAFALVRLAWIQANRGDDAAPATATAAVEVGRPGGVDCIPVYAAAIRGRYALGSSEFNAAARWLDQVAKYVEEYSLGNPITVPWAGDYVEALIRTARREEALHWLAFLDGQAHNTGLTWPAAIASRCKALLAVGDAADEHFAEAIHHHDRIESPFDRARTQLCWGNSLLRRRRRQPARAREHLLEALASFERLRATSWIEQTRAALSLAGAPVGEALRRPGLDDLTAQELQVSLAVARGLSNPEVAAALFLSRKSVERHLSAVYRKLGLRSRTELVAYVSRARENAPGGSPHGSQRLRAVRRREVGRA